MRGLLCLALLVCQPSYASDLESYSIGSQSLSNSTKISQFTVFLESRRKVCSATIIATNILLTAAHCKRAAEYFEYRGKKYYVKDFYPHPLYDDDNPVFNDDIALVYFKGNLPITDYPQLNTLWPTFAAGTSLELAGFGYDESGEYGNLRSYTQTTQNFDFYKYYLSAHYNKLSTKEQNEKAEQLEYVKQNQDKMLFTNINRRQHITDGDSGGPVLRYHNGSYVLVGVTSYYHMIKKKDKYIRAAAYSVYHYLDFIEHGIQELLAENEK